MPWREVTRVSLRKEFVLLAMPAGSNRRELCRRFGIAPKTGYKWLLRYAQAGASGLEDRSKRPRRSPARTATEVEQAVVRLRHESRNSWGGRKLAQESLEKIDGELPTVHSEQQTAQSDSRLIPTDQRLSKMREVDREMQKLGGDT